jgi:hypothetical protein
MPQINAPLRRQATNAAVMNIPTNAISWGGIEVAQRRSGCFARDDNSRTRKGKISNKKNNSCCRRLFETTGDG